MSSLAFEIDIKVDLEFFTLAGESYRKVRNTLRFLLGNLEGFDGSFGIEELPATSLDRWAVAEAARLSDEVIGHLRSYRFRPAHTALFDFCNDTLSAVYLNAVKDRLYCDRPDSPRRRATQAALHRITRVLVTLLAPIMPHTADEAWRALNADDACVQLEEFESCTVSADPAWSTVMELRDEVLKSLENAKSSGIENKLDAGVIVADPDGVLQPFAADLADLFGCSRVTLDPGATAVVVEDLREEPRCERSWRRDGTVRQRGDGGWLSDRDAEAVGIA